MAINVCVSESAATAWTLAATDIVDDFDVLDSDTVLDADDLKKPDPASLRSMLAGFAVGTAVLPGIDMPLYAQQTVYCRHS